MIVMSDFNPETPVVNAGKLTLGILYTQVVVSRCICASCNDCIALNKLLTDACFSVSVLCAAWS